MFQTIYKKMFAVVRLGILVVGCAALGLVSCKKEMREEIYPASLTIVNAVNDNSSFFSAYFGETRPKIFNRLAYIKSGDAMEYGTNKTTQPVRIFRNYDTMNFDRPFLQTQVNLEPGGIFTHFIYGSTAKPLQKTIKENLPARSINDSVVNLRIINLFDTRPVDVVQIEPVAGTMVSDLAYEQLSDFIKVPANAAVGSFRFEVRDHATGVVIASIAETNILPGTRTPNPQWLFKARTMLVTGTWTGSGNFNARATTIGHF